MECWLRDFFKNLNIREFAVIVIVVLVGGYSIIAPIITPQLKTEILQKPKEDFHKEPFSEVITIYKAINIPDDIIPIDCEAVLPVVYTKVISLKSLPVKQRKKKFIDLMLPSILIKNYEIKVLRRKLIDIQKKLNKNTQLTKKEEEFLSQMLTKYKASSLIELLKKVNTHPPSLVLAQSAIESGWGTSRFFVKANNVFGVWTFNKNQPLKIKAKNSNAYLKVYKNILEAVEDYYYSINVSWAYSTFREVRLSTKNPLELSNYLDKYSILRDRYVKRLKTIIQQNNLTFYDNCKLNTDFLK